MVVVKLCGGLGNQLFQYAAGRSLANKKQVPLRLDKTWYETSLNRSYRLHHFNIVGEAATANDVARICHATDSLRGEVLRRIERLLPRHKRSVFSERSVHHYDPKIRATRKDVMISGYWQSEKYFCDIVHVLRAEVTLKNAPSFKTRAVANRMRDTEAVSLHVRRGDYIQHPTHNVCSVEYYRNAIARLTTIIRNPHFFVFSDDMSWAAENIVTSYPTTYVSHNGQDRDYEDLWLMQQCRHHIIANSSFSWWGAWLAPNPGKVVVAPDQWFRNSRPDTKDRLPLSWLRVTS